MNAPTPDHDAGQFDRLLQQARAGSREALGQLLQPFLRVLRHRARQQVRDDLQSKGSGSDLIQDTLLEAQRCFAQFRGRSPEELTAWLSSILTHNGHNFRRQYLQSEKRRVDRELSLDDVRVAAGLQGRLLAGGDSPSSAVAGREQADALRQALERLPPLQRLIVYLRGYEDFSFPEIGAAVGCTEDAARKTWCRAIRLLAGHMR